MTEAAQPHHSDSSILPGGPQVYPEMAAAGLWTTPSDLARYAIETQRALEGKSSVLSATMARQMLTPIPGMREHGLGPALGGHEESRYFYHSGSNKGFKGYFVFYNKGDGAVVMANSDNADALRRDIMSTIAHEYNWPDFQPTTGLASVDYELVAQIGILGVVGILGTAILRRQIRKRAKVLR